MNRTYFNDIYEELNENTYDLDLADNDNSISDILKQSNYYIANNLKSKKSKNSEINEYSKLQLNKNSENNKYSKLERKDNLPEGWIKLFDNITQKYYYACTITKHTQWLNPTIPIGKMMKNGLPYGWEKEYDENSNRYYYINHVGRFTTWNPPIKQRSYKGKDYKW